ncbi:MAG: hypothetical protein P8M28_07390 [Alphaproteobacteria bacterium]|jgi:hypothetical protein|nr:hypothetical protein [Alphaproteobacteria bacterium]
MRIAMLRAARAVVMTVFALLVAAFVGLSVYAVLQFGLWWPAQLELSNTLKLVCAALTMLPFLLLFTKLNWSRPMGWIAVVFNRLIAPIDRAMEG